jgi:hypothetical protein
LWLLVPNPLIILLGVAAAVWLIGNVFVPARLWSTRNDYTHQFRSDPSESHLIANGGVAWSWYFFYWRVGRPLIRVEIDESAISISSSSKWLRWTVPPVTIPWLRAESVTRSGLGIVIRMPKQPGQMRVVLSQGSLPNELERLGVLLGG